jgi:putative hydroxymethylpyrimidine transport system substrate-binding protein
VEGIELEQRGYTPTIIPLDRAGVPTYDELVLVANSDRLHSSKTYADTVGTFVAAFLQGSADAKANPERSLEILGKVTAAKHDFLAASTPATLDLLGDGCLRETAWQQFGTWMYARDLLKTPVPAQNVMTTRFLGPDCEQ